jgi:hypothetical protein
VAKQLFNLEVTQRVSSTTYARWEAELPGPKSRQALVALADASAFLPLPPDELPAIPALDRAVQDSLLSRTRNYVANTIPKLPNFFATRDAIDFSDETEDVESMTLVDYQQRSNRGCCGLNTIRASSLPPRGWHHRGDRRETGAPISEHPACGRTLNF